MIRVHEVVDPGYHRGVREAVAGRPGGVVFDVEHAGKGDAVSGPATAVRDEVVCLGCTGGTGGLGEVV